ncbi:sigma factor-like helix-turn-helix DNA-binding protein [Streptomonospora nanhaiensis]|uniref:Ketosteroid isomerase-like protein n=1 Tax=Streptomonospora nanhaiensis TaxID=1323731 RepID=A0A853BXE4_9ACTN|nr:sigma factor-like helix-turn-helix DNA-binding protein [Streptomonospora nanhaiensis]NYI99161.1 ketosteroid isomerase-like protein [Streptomonospora nanhaiensis]
MAALLLLERLTPLESAVFVLRDVCGFGFPDIASAVGRSEAACRQLAVRARRHMDGGRPRFAADRAERERLAGRFLDAFRDGDVDGLTALPAADAEMVGDGGGKAPQWGERLAGAAAVARVPAGVVPLFARISARAQARTLNGRPGAVFSDRGGRVLSTWTFDAANGRIQAIRTLNNPDKPRRVGPVADAWAALAEARA